MHMMIRCHCELSGSFLRRLARPSESRQSLYTNRIQLYTLRIHEPVTAGRRGTAWSSSSACRCTMCPGRRSVQPDHQRTPKAAVPWGESFCFPLMAPPVTPTAVTPSKWHEDSFEMAQTPSKWHVSAVLGALPYNHI